MATFDLTAPEVWYHVPGYPLYEISSHLRVRSYKLGPAKIIKIHTNSNGYRKLVLWKGRRYYNLYLHRVVALLAFGPCPDGQKVRHLDDDKTNNWPENLAYGTAADNAADFLRNRRTLGEACGSSKLDGKKVVEIYHRAVGGESMKALAKEFGVSEGTVRNIKNKKTWGHLHDNRAIETGPDRNLA
jgi:hypothetical protein